MIQKVFWACSIKVLVQVIAQATNSTSVTTLTQSDSSISTLTFANNTCRALNLSLLEYCGDYISDQLVPGDFNESFYDRAAYDESMTSVRHQPHFILGNTAMF
jgi:hypothetical protein